MKFGRSLKLGGFTSRVNVGLLATGSVSSIEHMSIIHPCLTQAATEIERYR